MEFFALAMVAVLFCILIYKPIIEVAIGGGGL